ncbi:MAG: hypothetical protein ACI9HK_004772, partial [Pirellulaceae bacterium]
RYLHDNNTEKGEKTVTFDLKVPKTDKYLLLLSYSSGSNRDKKVPVRLLSSGDLLEEYMVDQSKRPTWGGSFHLLGEFEWTQNRELQVVVSTEGTKQHVIADGVWIVPVADVIRAQASVKKLAVAPKPATAKSGAKKTAPEPLKVVEFKPLATKQKFAILTPAELDKMLEEKVPGITTGELTTDEHFLRRASLDLLGRQPTRDELLEFLSDNSQDKRGLSIDRMLMQEEYGRNWANFWVDVIGSRQQEPQLTFHDYTPFRTWLTNQLNEDKSWNETVFRMMTAQGKVGATPEATFIGFHQGDANRIAGEVTRVFLSTKIACAECHDHPFQDMPQETFHGIAAFFVRAEAKIAQLDSNGIEVVSKPKGEQAIEGKKGSVKPMTLAGDEYDLSLADIDRRTTFGHWLVSADNARFSQTYVNRVWARLLGRGFAEPVDEMGENATIVAPEILESLASHFVANEFRPRAVFRLLMTSKAYQQASKMEDDKPLLTAIAKKLRGDEVFDSLVQAIGIENVTPERQKKTGAVRFPPPPKSTRDLVNVAFGYDPSFSDNLITRTMKQAMFMMNNPQIQAHIDASEDKDTMLAKLLKEEKDDAKAVAQLYQRVLARNPTDREIKIANDHLGSVKDRKSGFEDLLWCLLNSAEFTTKF